MGRKLLGEAVGVLAVLGDVARHAAWYVRYQVDGHPRSEHPPHDEEPHPDR